MKKNFKNLLIASLLPPILMLAILPLNENFLIDTLKFILMPGAILFVNWTVFQSIPGLIFIFFISWVCWFILASSWSYGMQSIRSSEKKVKVQGYIIIGAVCAVILIPIVFFSFPKYGFKDTKSIILEFNNHQRKSLTIIVNNLNEVEYFVSKIELIRKEACACDHFWKACFKNEGGEIEVSFCDHCFNVRHGKSWKYYKMPKPFYELFLKQLDKNNLDRNNPLEIP